MCYNKQKWNKEKCRCECLKKEKRSGNSIFNVINCSGEMKIAAALIEEECDIETSKKIDCYENKTLTLIKKIVSHLLLQVFYLFVFQRYWFVLFFNINILNF